MTKDRGRVVGVIPARLASTRLPHKVLRPLAGRPLLAWVHDAAERARQEGLLDEVVVAVDTEEVAALCRQEGWRWEMTSSTLQSGTDRLREVTQRVPAAIYVNVQGDEPLLEVEHLRALLRPFGRAEVDVATLKVACSAENLANPNAVKVVTARDGRALYFSRATVPFDRDGDGCGAPVWKHMGVYAYRRAALERFAALPVGELERTERLEQLRFLENGLSVFVEAVERDTVGVDTEEDLLAVEAVLRDRVRG